MDINITKETFNINKIVCEKKEIITVQGDIIVPDSKPDILNTINTSGNVCIYKKEVMDGKVRIDGNILTYIMYLADESRDNIRGINTGLDFSEAINVSEIQSGMEVELNTKIKVIECKVLNGRKVGVKVNLEVSIKAYSKEDINIVTNMNDENIQTLCRNININSLLGEGSTKTYVKENISIPATDNLAEILSAQACLVDKDIKISYNKVLAKSEVEIKLVYLTEDGRICISRNRVPLVGFIDMPNIKEENICETPYMIKNIIIKPNAVEEHSVYIELEVEITCKVYEEKEIKVIQDMYCPGEKMLFDTNTVNTITNKQCKRNICSIREKVNIPELENGNIIDVEINPIINKENKLNGKIIFEGELELNFIYIETSTVGVNTKKINLPFEHTIDGIENIENSRVDTTIDVNAQEFANQAGVVNSNVDLNFETNMYRNSEIPVIDNISVEEEENLEDYSVIIYVVKKGDTLWNIAKRFGSTVDDIVRVNGIERPDKLNVGEKIYIPKYVLKRAKEPITISQNV
ncbi:MAG: DUF3794 domain-containing protein [Clostridia bacterium]|nr:DUF3794 domain-containing protein [Clostridia bacterium]